MSCGMRRWTRAASVLAAALAAVLVLGAASAAAEKSARRTPPKPRSSAEATAALGLDLLRELPPGNAVVSPDSIATALAMAGTGARGAPRPRWRGCCT